MATRQGSEGAPTAPAGDAVSGLSGKRAKSVPWANFLLLAASLLVGLIAAEIALGFTAYRHLTKPRTDYPPGYFVEDPDLGVDLVRNYPPAPFRMRGPAFDAFTNQWGCFDHDGPLPEDYVLAVGDSSTWGYAPFGHTWLSQLEGMSERRILKCGVSGTGPRYQALKARKVIDQIGHPPAVLLVLYDTWNDLNDDMVFPGYGVVSGYRGHTLKSLDLRTGDVVRHTREAFERKYSRYVKRRDAFDLRRFLVEHLTIAAMISHAFEAPRNQHASAQGPTLERRYDFSLWNVDPARFPWIDQAVADHLDNLRQLRWLASEMGAELVLITDGLPNQGLHQRLLDFLADEIPHHVDVREATERAAEGRRIRHHHDTHWNQLGNRLAADVLDRYLRESGLL